MEKSIPAIEITPYAAIRLSTDHEGDVSYGGWIDTDTISHCLQTAKRLAEQNDAKIPHWAKDNRIIRFARIKITEMETIEEIKKCLENQQPKKPAI
jgi:hypothetical protein